MVGYLLIVFVCRHGKRRTFRIYSFTYSLLLTPSPVALLLPLRSPRASAGQRRMRSPPFMGRSVRRDAPTEIHQSFGRSGAWIVGRPESRPVVVTKA